MEQQKLAVSPPIIKMLFQLMLTNGSARPGAASAAVRCNYVLVEIVKPSKLCFLRKQSSGVDPTCVVGKSIFGGRLTHINSGESI